MREKIIDTAIEEFTRNGLKFTMNDVAKALGISKKTGCADGDCRPICP